MFFTNELLDKREGGFGLLWLAATLGHKSTFKKLPRRSVLTADIPELCNLISTPAEPMALRLSSNLMVGVARVYKVKQEMLMTDVTNCSNSLKKVVQEFRSTAAADAQLQMAQPNTKASALTIAGGPDGDFVMNFDDLVADWDEYLDIGNAGKEADDDEDAFEPKSKKARQKRKTKLATPAEAEEGRADPHVLNEEHHKHYLNNSLDLSMSQEVGGGISSSQAGGFDGFDFGDGEELDLGLGDMGGGAWGLSPVKSPNNDGVDVYPQGPADNMDFDMGDLNGGGDFDLGGMDVDMNIVPDDEFELDEQGVKGKRKPRAPKATTADKENLPPSSLPADSSQQAANASPAKSAMGFSEQFMSQDEIHPQNTPAPEEPVVGGDKPAKRPAKRARLLQDAQTELTDAELKAGRTDYLESQAAVKKQLAQKQAEKDSGRLMEELIWGPPKTLRAPMLIDFWARRYKAQVEGRMNHTREDTPRPSNRDKTPTGAGEQNANNWDAEVGMGMNYDAEMGMDMDMYMGNFDNPAFDEPERIRSSEEPGQARNVSRPLSEIGSRFNFGAGENPDGPPSESQRSSIFPWDQAGGATSSGGVPFAQSEGSVDRAEVQVRRGSSARRDSSQDPCERGSGRVPFSPGSKGQLEGEDFEFDVAAQAAPEPESQASESNLVTLERNSYNFLEYAKMQFHTLPVNAPSLTFDHIVPPATSTRHVAASALYHCLVLGTKDLVRLNQPEPYGTLSIAVI